MKILNCVNHELTVRQVEQLGQIGQVENLSDVDANLFKKLAQCPADITELVELASALIKVVDGYYGIHLPLGSPAFMVVFTEMLSGANRPEFIFSHSERIVTESGGKKVVTFEFQELIRF